MPIPKPTPELIEQWLAEPEYRTPGRGQLVTLTADRLGKIINQAAQWGYVQCNAEYEDEPLVVTRAELPAVAGQSVSRLAVLHARQLLADPAVFEVIAHRGPSAQPERGDDVIARVCREPFRGCLTLAPSADTK